VVKVSVPKTLSANARELLQRFEQQAQEEEQGVFERLKGFFKD
jgi:DnaJ-class molecular chaperone